MRKGMVFGIVLAAFACGLIGAPPPCPPLEVGVYADHGPSGIGALEWYRLVDESPQMKLHLIDGAAVRSGALDGLDLFIMPGGNPGQEYKTLRKDGIEKMKEFVKSGGGYIGTCAGCCLLMDGPGCARMMPWHSTTAVPGTVFPDILINEKGSKALGLEKGAHNVRYVGGPCLWPTSREIPFSDMEVWATYNAEASLKGRLAVEMYGAAAMIGGTYGKGRVFAVSAHPEYFNSTLYIVEAAIKWVTGRKVTFPSRVRKPRALAVGFLVDGMGGVKIADTAVALAAEKDFDFTPLNSNFIRERALDHIDVLVVFNEHFKQKKVVCREINKFIGRGGKLVGFGEGTNAVAKKTFACGFGADAISGVRKAAMSPALPKPVSKLSVEMEKSAGKVAVKVGVYAGVGADGIGLIEWCRLVKESPEMELRLLDATAVRNGFLEGLDFVVVPDGNSVSVYDSLGKDGVEKLKTFVRKGGGYFGTGEGCRFALDSDKCLRLMPWISTGRENSTFFPTLKTTSKGAAALGFKRGVFAMRYHGGPFMWPSGSSIPLSKTDVWATYNAEVSTSGPIKSEEKMFGAGAIIGGTYGEGKVIAIAAQPEYYNSSTYIVAASVKWLTGRMVTFPMRPRESCSVNVGFLSKGVGSVNAVKLALDIAEEEDFDLVPVDAQSISRRALDHIDVLVLPSGSCADDGKLASEIDVFTKNGGKVMEFESDMNVCTMRLDTQDKIIGEIKALFLKR